MSGAGTAYDRVPYVTHVHPSMHPDRLAAIGTLLGMTPAPVERCRVLEVGCGNGTNLLGMAYALPDSEFVGIDLAATAIARGRESARDFGVANLTLEALDVMAFPDMGQFDYLIAHGFYSWVPHLVRDRLFALCNQHLSAAGVAFVSYNCYPGGHVRQMIREMLLFHVRGMDDPDEQVREVRELAKFLHASSDPGDREHDFYRRELARLAEASAWTIFHDELADVNQPVYFSQFMEHAANHGLQFLAEAEFNTMEPNTVPAVAADAVRAIPDADAVIKQQYLDFATRRMFRKTLLCRDDVALDRNVDPERLIGLYVSADLHPTSESPVMASTSVETFDGPAGARMSASDPLVKASLIVLGEWWPEARPPDAILAAAAERLEAAGVASDPLSQARDARRELLDVLLQAYRLGVVNLHTLPLPLTSEITSHPCTSRLARWMASSGDFVVTLRHTTVRLEHRRTKRLVALCDGTCSRHDLLGRLRALDDHATDEQEQEDLTPEILERNLRTLAGYGLMEA